MSSPLAWFILPLQPLSGSLMYVLDEEAVQPPWPEAWRKKHKDTALISQFGFIEERTVQSLDLLYTSFIHTYISFILHFLELLSPLYSDCKQRGETVSHAESCIIVRTMEFMQLSTRFIMVRMVFIHHFFSSLQIKFPHWYFKIVKTHRFFKCNSRKTNNQKKNLFLFFRENTLSNYNLYRSSYHWSSMGGASGSRQTDEPMALNCCPPTPPQRSAIRRTKASSLAEKSQTHSSVSKGDRWEVRISSLPNWISVLYFFLSIWKTIVVEKI